MRKKGILTFVTAWMELEGILLIDKLEKDRFCMISLNMWNL